jgi:hypothetical protein
MNLNDAEVTELYRVRIPNNIATLEKLDDNMDISRA